MNLPFLQKREKKITLTELNNKLNDLAKAYFKPHEGERILITYRVRGRFPLIERDRLSTDYVVKESNTDSLGLYRLASNYVEKTINGYRKTDIPVTFQDRVFTEYVQKNVIVTENPITISCPSLSLEGLKNCEKSLWLLKRDNEGDL